MIYEKLKSTSNLDVYIKEAIPDDLNYKNNIRIGDLIAVAKLGFTISATNLSSTVRM